MLNAKIKEKLPHFRFMCQLLDTAAALSVSLAQYHQSDMWVNIILEGDEDDHKDYDSFHRVRFPLQGDLFNWPSPISVPKRKSPISQSQLLFQ